jgi:hypothetical protein
MTVLQSSGPGFVATGVAVVVFGLIVIVFMSSIEIVDDDEDW